MFFPHETAFSRLRSSIVASPSCHVTLLPFGGPFNARGVERRRERRDVRCVTVRQPGRAGIAPSGMPGASASAGVGADIHVPSAAHGPVSVRQSGSNSPPGRTVLALEREQATYLAVTGVSRAV
jgi:hypothetical protein